MPRSHAGQVNDLPPPCGMNGKGRSSTYPTMLTLRDEHGTRRIPNFPRPCQPVACSPKMLRQEMCARFMFDEAILAARRVVTLGKTDKHGIR